MGGIALGAVGTSECGGGKGGEADERGSVVRAEWGGGGAGNGADDGGEGENESGHFEIV